MSEMTYIPDPIERGEQRAEASHEMRDGKIRCVECRDFFDENDMTTASPDPYAPPVCFGCLGGAYMAWAMQIIRERIES